MEEGDDVLQSNGELASINGTLSNHLSTVPVTRQVVGNANLEQDCKIGRDELFYPIRWKMDSKLTTPCLFVIW